MKNIEQRTKYKTNLTAEGSFQNTPLDLQVFLYLEVFLKSMERVTSIFVYGTDNFLV